MLNLFADDTITKLTNNEKSTVNIANETQITELLNKGIVKAEGNTTIQQLNNESEFTVSGTSEFVTAENQGKMTLNGYGKESWYNFCI